MPKKDKKELPPQKLLVIRFSAIGDVAMTIPSLWSIAYDNPYTKVTFVSQGFARDFVEQVPGIVFCEADLKNRHNGLGGIFRLYRDIKRLGSYDMVVDLHNVIRSRILCFLFRLHGVKCVRINKGRSDKRKLVRQDNKVFKQLPTTFERYANTFKQIGIEVTSRFDYFFHKAPLSDKVLSLTGNKDRIWVGIAPYAKHKGKIYPINLMEKVVAKLSRTGKYKVFLFGSGGLEKHQMEEWEAKYPNVKSLARRFPLLDELKVISNLDALICMDSANMHFASLVNTPVVSIWGATHRYAGFYGWRQNPKNAVQVDLPCRPCSVYGNKRCSRGDYACLNQISPSMIIDKLNKVVG